jgi:hypothetical protein
VAESIKLVGQRQTEKVLDDGEVHSVVVVSVLVDGMGPFSADIPVDEWHPDNLEPIIRDIAWRARTIRYNAETDQQAG